VRTAREILKSIVADVEGMKADAPEDIMRDSGSEDKEHWFGPFELGENDQESYTGFSVQWPNLGILIEEAKKCVK
jgi:hypothetical protein